MSNIAWAAGLVEGEGCFTWHSEGKHPYFLMDMTDKDVLERFQTVFPFVTLRGPYAHKKKPSHKPRWRVDAFGPKALILMKAVLPYMGKRRTEKIQEFLVTEISPATAVPVVSEGTPEDWEDIQQ